MDFASRGIRPRIQQLTDDVTHLDTAPPGNGEMARLAGHDDRSLSR